MNERLWFLIAAGFAAGGTLWTFVPQKNRSLSRRGVQMLLFFAFLSLSFFLFQRGEIIHRCPLTNGFEATAFLTWGLLLTYFLIGSSYRFSILGAFTAPLTLTLQLLAFLLTSDLPLTTVKVISWKSEFHAAISVLSYGTLGLAAISGGMYLIQEHHLKSHQLTGWFNRLPSMGDLETVLHRLIRWGFFLLTLGVISGFSIGLSDKVSAVKLLWIAIVWLWYLFLLLSPRLIRLSHRRFAWASLIGYLLVLLSFGVMNFLIERTP